jgi:predicted nucleic acid-binding protein
MPFYFFDASAAVKVYHPETGTDKVLEIYRSPDNGILISDLSYTEVLSALNRKKQNGAISQLQFDDMIGRFFFDYQNKYLVMDFYDDVRILAGKLIMRRNIRSGDSIQLATALDNEDVVLTFVSADDKLCTAATSEGLQVLNPEK